VSSTSITGLKVRGTNVTTSIKVELAESIVNGLFSLCVHFASETKQEFVKVDVTISIGVEVGKKAISLFFGKVTSALIDSNEELLGINLSVTVFVKGVEYSSEASKSFGTSCVHLVFNLAENYIIKQKN